MLQLILAVRDVVRVFIVLIEVGFFFSATASTAQMMQNSSTVLEQGTSTQTTTHGKELKSYVLSQLASAELLLSSVPAEMLLLTPKVMINLIHQTAYRDSCVQWLCLILAVKHGGAER